MKVLAAFLLKAYTFIYGVGIKMYCWRCNGLVLQLQFDDLGPRCVICGRGLVEPRLLPENERPYHRRYTDAERSVFKTEIMDRRRAGQDIFEIADSMGLSVFMVESISGSKSRAKSAAVAVMEKDEE